MTAYDANPFPNSATSPIVWAEDVTPSDSATLMKVTRAVYVGTGGDLAVHLIGGTAITFKNVANGTLLPIRVDQVLATGTTADDIRALS